LFILASIYKFLRKNCKSVHIDNRVKIYVRWRVIINAGWNDLNDLTDVEDVSSGAGWTEEADTVDSSFTTLYPSISLIKFCFLTSVHSQVKCCK